MENLNIVKNKINRYRYYEKFHRFLLFIKVDENCNLQCSFCYQGEKEQFRIDNEKVLKKCLFNLDYGIRKFLSLAATEDFEYSSLSICFFGGEPTLNLWAINKICDHIIKTYTLKERNKLNITYTSNGIIFNEDVKNTLRKMKEVNDKPTTVLISTDNDKEVYDKNRKLVGKEESGFDIVQRNIKLYKEFLSILNNGNEENNVRIATVLATSEQIYKSPMYIKNKFKDIIRSSKFLYVLDKEDKGYIPAGQKFLQKAYSYLIEQCTLENKEKGIEEIVNTVFPLNDKTIGYDECSSTCTIGGNGEVNWCNKHKYFDKEILSQNAMREYIFNREVDNSHFSCKKNKFSNGEQIKDKITNEAWKQMIARFDPNVPIIKLNINKNFNKEIALYNFIKYMIGSTDVETREIYISNPSEKIINLCKEFDVKISKQPIKNDIENTFYIDQEGNLFFDEIFKDDKDMILTDLKEKHFMWIHTPTLLNSVNKYFLEKLSC